MGNMHTMNLDLSDELVKVVGKGKVIFLDPSNCRYG